MAECIIKSSLEENQIKSTLLVIETSTKEISDNFLDDQCDETSFGKLKKLINALTNINVPQNMIDENKRKSSIMKYLMFLRSCEENKRNSNRTRCKNCKWILCQCFSSENHKNLTANTSEKSTFNKEEISDDRVWAKASRSFEKDLQFDESTETKIDLSKSLLSEQSDVSLETIKEGNKLLGEVEDPKPSRHQNYESFQVKMNHYM